MSILDNAVRSIQVGVEDYNTNTDARMLSAVRSVMAGLLLLYKEKLVRLSPDHDREALIKSKVIPTKLEDGSISIVGKSKTTVSFQQIEERFEQFSVNVDWKRLKKIRDLRNDIEHYYTKLSKDNVKEVLAGSFILIRDFLSQELSEDPLEVLGDKCWQSLLDVSEVYENERKECLSSFSKIDWTYKVLKDCTEYFRCTECHSSLLRTDNTGAYHSEILLNCASCGNTFEIESVLEGAVDDMLGIDAHIAHMDGGEPPFGMCPTCLKNTFIFYEDVCISCENELDYKECLRCGESLSVDEQDLDGFCGYCSNQKEKMMAE